MRTNRYIISFIVTLFLVFCSPVFARIECDDCGSSGTLEGPYTATFSVDPTLAGGCEVTITYSRRTCNSVTNIFITGYKLTGTNCPSIPSVTIIDRALSVFLSNSPPFPPYELTDPPAIWRVVRPVCWKQVIGTTEGDTTIVGCPEAPCCITYYGARNNNCAKIVTYLPKFYQNNSLVCPPDTTCTIRSCGYDPLDAWK